MKIRRRHREGTELSADSLNDIMFFLLIFFLIISTLASPSAIKVNLPNSKNNAQVPMKPVELFAVRNPAAPSQIDYYINKTKVDIINIESVLTNTITQVKDPTVILKFDNTLSVQDMVNVLQIGAKLNVKMVIGTKPPNAG